MPLKRMLSANRAFDPRAVAVLLEAFEEVVAELDLRNDADREKAAKRPLTGQRSAPRSSA